MAKTLSKSGITTTSTIEAWHVTQSIDALTGTDAYNVTISGSLLLPGTTASGSFIGDGSGLTGITAEWDGSHLGDASITGSLTTTGTISASGDLLGDRITAASYIRTPTIESSTGIIRIDDNINALGHITASGNISSSGDITADGFSSEEGKVVVDINVTTPVIKSATSVLQVLDNLDVVGHITASGNISGSSTSTSSFGTYLGDGSQLTGISAGGSSLWYDGTTYLSSSLPIKVDSHITASGNISASGNIFAQNITVYDDGVTTPAINSSTGKINFSNDSLFNIANITASGNISASGNVYGVTGSFSHVVGNSPLTIGSPVTFTSPITASSGSPISGSFIGDGSQLIKLCDRQVGYTGSIIATTDDTYVTCSTPLTTGNLGGNGDYMVYFNCDWSNVAEKEESSFRLKKDGSVLPFGNFFQFNTKNTDGETFHTSFQYMAPDVTSGTIFDVDFANTTGDEDLTAITSSLIIDGVPTTSNIS